VRDLLTPNGRYILETNQSDSATYDAVLSTLTHTFPIVRTHNDTIAVSGTTPETYDEGTVEQVFTQFGPSFGLTTSGAEWFSNGWKRHVATNYTSIEPITDDAVYFEYRR
jgi:hypothetical protein